MLSAVDREIESPSKRVTRSSAKTVEKDTLATKAREAVFLDTDVLPFLNKGTLPKERQEIDKIPRIFSWVPNSFIPQFLHPLVRAYVDIGSVMLKDPRDIMFVSHIIWAFMTIVPSALYLLYSFSWIHALFHGAGLIISIPPFILMLHCVCHKPMAKKGYGFLDFIVHYVLAPFHGQTWNTFYYHHVKHHHVEDNWPSDLSSTVWYDRDNALHFLIYFFRFYLFIGFELPAYFIRKRQYIWALNTFCGEFLTLAFYASFFNLCSNPLSVFFAWFLPFNFSRIGMMSGNWVQHAFVQVDDPTCDYKTAITCVDDWYNKTCFNDGYHTSHHLNPLRHWADHPNNFVSSLEKFHEKNTVVFKGLDYWGVLIPLLCKDYKKLAKHFVVTAGHMDEDEIINLLKSRTRRMTSKEIDMYFPKKSL